MEQHNGCRYDSVPHEPVGVAESLDKYFTDPPTAHNTQDSVQLSSIIDNSSNGRSTTVTSLTVLYDFKGDNDSELTVTNGETVLLLSGATTDEWCLVEKEGSRGYVPSNYLQTLTN